MVIKKKEEMDDEDKTEEFLNSFYKQAKETLNNLRKKRTTIYHTYDEISEFLGLKYVTKGNFIGIEQFISIMKEFFKKTEKEFEKSIENIDVNDNDENIINITIISFDQKINFPKSLNSNTKFYIIEDFIYNKYPEYKENDNYFLVNGAKINRFKTLKENNIKNGDIIMLNSID